MKCPKCSYLSLDGGPRCLNCGYELSLAGSGPEPPELEVEVAPEPIVPLGDLSLRAPQATPDLAQIDRTLSPPPEPELPLFGSPTRRSRDEAPLVAPAAPRRPLAVRRATPDPDRARGPVTPRPRPPTPPSLDLGPAPARRSPSPGRRPAAEGPPPAPAPARLGAAAIDAAILLAIDAVVVYFTLRMVALGPGEIDRLPLLPLAAFLLLLKAGYLASFTAASGQTIGKMIAGVRVVALEGRHVRFPQAVGRTAAVALTCLTLGLGFLPAFGSGAGRALHDRLADTRVVRA